MAGNPLVNFLIYLVVVAIPPVLFLLVLHLPRLYRAIRTRRAPAVPAGRPIEEITADLRRVHGALVALPDGTNRVRRRATVLAYDELLTQAAQAIGEPVAFGGAPEGIDRELERLRVEWVLIDAGLRIHQRPTAEGSTAD